MKSTTVTNSTAERLKQWKSEKSTAKKENTKQAPGSTNRPSSGSSKSNGNNLHTTGRGGLGPASASLKAKSTPIENNVEIAAAIISDDVLDDVDGEYDVAYLQTILKQLLLLRYRMLVQHSKEKQSAGTA